ncbi:MAG: hypothetical protein J2P45_07120 [Candidatus Dormibacteraeota bacterium]|nr:hypothetical protein [Candidatus Dormibacteraeota bacterium]
MVHQTLSWYRARSPFGRTLIAIGLFLFALVLAAALPGVLRVLAAAGVALLVVAFGVAILAFLSLPFVALGFAGYAMVRALRGAGPASAPARAPGLAPPRAAQPLPSDSTAGLPPQVAEMVARIQAKAAALRGTNQSTFLGPDDQHHIDSLLNQYLPGCLATYRALPQGSTSQPADAEGKSADQLVMEQLALLEQGLDQISRRVLRAGAAQLIAQQRFLEERLRADPEWSETPVAEKL